MFDLDAEDHHLAVSGKKGGRSARGNQRSDAHGSAVDVGRGDGGHQRRPQSQGHGQHVAGPGALGVDQREEAVGVAGRVQRQGEDGLTAAGVVAPAADEGEDLRTRRRGVAHRRDIAGGARHRDRLGLPGDGQLGQGGDGVRQLDHRRAVPAHDQPHPVRQLGLARRRRLHGGNVVARNQGAAQGGGEVLLVLWRGRRIRRRRTTDSVDIHSPEATPFVFAFGVRRVAIRGPGIGSDAALRHPTRIAEASLHQPAVREWIGNGRLRLLRR